LKGRGTISSAKKGTGHSSYLSKKKVIIPTGEVSVGLRVIPRTNKKKKKKNTTRKKKDSGPGCRDAKEVEFISG